MQLKDLIEIETKYRIYVSDRNCELLKIRKFGVRSTGITWLDHYRLRLLNKIIECNISATVADIIKLPSWLLPNDFLFIITSIKRLTNEQF